MSQTLLSYLQRQLSSEAVSQMSGFLGEPPAQTGTAVSAGLQGLLAALAQKATSATGAADVVGLIDRVQAETAGSVPSQLASGASIGDMARLGAPLLAALLGSQQAAVIAWLASTAGIGKSSAGSLLGLLAPLVVSGLGRYLSAESGGVSTASLTTLLSSESATWVGGAPAGLAGALGLEGLGDLARGTGGHAPHPVESEPRDTGLGFLRWVIPLLAVAALLAYMVSRQETVDDAARLAADNAAARATTVGMAAATVADSATATASGGVTSLGALVERTLPNMASIRVPEHGIESRLLTFITDASRPVDTTTWFSFDRLEFDTASATLRPSSNDQLDAMAAILEAYPNVHLKIGGYTDNVGDAGANLRLSAARAENTMQALLERGIGVNRLESEGYGEQHPVASNDTDEGRQRNRRIDVRVVRK